ncbi:uncharacterized protein LOC130941522 [Arachis stenosperma]|uniref:uncharacterized protein LOC130941522 n=1 Tax=Arachis stenosperma TaxID=217475 RepID=UPI0025ACF4FA|nr:uncharacterized protein LOC130941522 [Arachis stenosperma]
MESNNIPIMAKKVWNMVRVVFFMLRRGISKGKLMMDLNMFLKRRRKLAGKAIYNLMFHHHHHSNNPNLQFSAPREYEFSCSNTPNNHYFFPIGKRHRNHNHHFFACTHAPPTLDDDVVTANALKAVLEILNNNNNNNNNDQVMMAMVEASPALPGFGRSPMVRQLRVTDSPFPLYNDDKDDHQVDKAAEEFIKRFYKELRKQD